MIKNYIFDFGNVLCEFTPEKMTEPFVTDEKDIKAISEVVFDRAYWDKLDKGIITDDYVRGDIVARLPGEVGKIGCEVYNSWMKTITPIDETVSLVYDLHKNGKKLYLLSNISITFATTYNEVPWIKELFGVFDGLVFSGPIGIVKPTKSIFDHLINKYELQREECLFIDDTERNIEGAKLAGISGYLFDGNAEKLRKYIGM